MSVILWGSKLGCGMGFGGLGIGRRSGVGFVARDACFGGR